MGIRIEHCLVQVSSVPIDLGGLLLGGMIIGSLGVLDDLVTSQSAAVVEIHDANRLLDFGVFQKAMRIGQDHVAATGNHWCWPTRAPRCRCC